MRGCAPHAPCGEAAQRPRRPTVWLRLGPCGYCTRRPENRGRRLRPCKAPVCRRHTGASGKLLLAGLAGSALDLALAEAGLEAGHAAAGVEDLLLARVERVAIRAHVGVDRTALGGGPGHERVAAAASHGGDLVGRVNLRLHYSGSLPQAAAGSSRPPGALPSLRA